MVLEDQHKQAREELIDRQEQLRSRPSPHKMKKDQQEIKLLENHLDKALVKFNDLQSGNKTLRKEIDVWRKQQRNQTRVNRVYQREISAQVEQVKKVNNSTYQGQRISEETNNQILALKQKHETDKLNFEDKIQTLQAKLRERDDNEHESQRTKTGAEDKSKDFMTAEFSNPAALLKPRLAKWKANNQEKKSLMDMYIRNVKIIEDAFEQIKEQTGISSVEEIVTTFVKAEEQNYSLYNYVNMLNSDIDMIEEQNKSIEQEIKRHEQLSSMSEAEKATTRVNLQNEIDEMRAKNQGKEAQINTMETQMHEIKEHVQGMVDKFELSHF